MVPRRTPSRLGAHAAPRLTQALPAAALPEGPRAQGTGADRAARAPGRAPLPIPSEQTHCFSNPSDTPARHDGLLRPLFGLAVAVTGHSALQPAPGGTGCVSASVRPAALRGAENAGRWAGTGRARPAQPTASDRREAASTRPKGPDGLRLTPRNTCRITDGKRPSNGPQWTGPRGA